MDALMGDVEFGSPAFGQPHAAGFALVFHADLVDGVHLPSLGQQACDFLSDLGHRLVIAASLRCLSKGLGGLNDMLQNFSSSW